MCLRVFDQFILYSKSLGWKEEIGTMELREVAEDVAENKTESGQRQLWQRDVSYPILKMGL